MLLILQNLSMNLMHYVDLNVQQQIFQLLIGYVVVVQMIPVYALQVPHPKQDAQTQKFVKIINGPELILALMGQNFWV